jgi:methionine-R-sulfoxide reductase
MRFPFSLRFLSLAAPLTLLAGIGSLWLFAAPPSTDRKDKSNTETGQKSESSDQEGESKESEETAKVPAFAKRSNTTKGKKMKDEPEYNKLTPEERWVILNKGTEYAFTGRYTDHFVEGTYICKRCNAPLYESKDKFHSGCGWPAFDDEIKDSIKRKVDADGYRIEILCNNCDGHLGHVFNGEMMTAKNTRHCVNSLSIRFVPKGKELPKVIRNEDAKVDKEDKNAPVAPAKSDNKSESESGKKSGS